MGSYSFPQISYFGPWQATGVLIGHGIIALGFMMIPVSAEVREIRYQKSQSAMDWLFIYTLTKFITISVTYVGSSRLAPGLDLPRFSCIIRISKPICRP